MDASAAKLLLGTKKVGRGKEVNLKKGRRDKMGKEKERYVELKDVQGKEWTVEQWLCNFAKNYGWTSEMLDEDMALAIEKGERDPKDPYGLGQSLGAGLAVKRVVQFIRGELSEDEDLSNKRYGIDTSLKKRRKENDGEGEDSGDIEA